jgi:plasmid maintenance system antidote protein VapI
VVLKDGWPAEVTITVVAKQLGVTRAALSRILNGHAAICTDFSIGTNPSSSPKF